jgi:hypothetical protein
MGGIASNDAELAAILAPAVVQGLQIMGEGDLEPLIQDIISSATHRGSFYQAGGGGSLERAWTTKSNVGGGMELGEMETHYDSAKLSYDSGRGQHITPDSVFFERSGFDDPEAIEDMASLIDQGLGGMLFGPDNPTRHPTMFWDAVLSQFKAEGYEMIKKGLIAAGLPVM